MPQCLISEPAEAILNSLVQALDLVNVGVLLLDRNLRARFINRRQAELFALPPALLASGPKFRDLLNHAGASGWFAVAQDKLPDYLNQREAAVQSGTIPPTQINLHDGRRVLFSCVPCPDGGRILTYTDISQELWREADNAVERVRAELRYKTETLEDQAAYLVSLAEAADESARNVEAARVALEERIAQHHQLETELRRMATTDGLTGVLNRVGFLSCAQRLLEQGKHAAVVMLDVDHFKSINDRYGHAGGDCALQHLAIALRTETRDEDLLGRLGGEEFAIAMPAVLPDEAAAAAERLRKQVAGTVIPYGDRSIRMTVSIGIATQQPADREIADIMLRADGGLYQAKRNGRNQVIQTQPTVA